LGARGGWLKMMECIFTGVSKIGFYAVLGKGLGSFSYLRKIYFSIDKM